MAWFWLIAFVVAVIVALFHRADSNYYKAGWKTCSAKFEEAEAQRDNLQRIADAERGYAAAEHERAEYFHGELLKLAEKIKAKAAESKPKGRTRVKK